MGIREEKNFSKFQNEEKEFVMKKSKLLVLLSVLMIAAMLLSSCGGAKQLSKISSFKKVVSAGYMEDPAVEASVALTELNGYVIAEQSAEFVLFKSGSGVAGKVFSFRTGTIVKSLDSFYDIDIYDVPIFVVCTTDEEDVSTYTAYDATGAELISTKDDLGEPESFADLVRYGDALYAIDEEKTGKLTKVLDVPETLLIDGTISWSEKYFYDMGSDYYDRESVTIYDRDLAFVTAWYAPSTAESITFSVLNSGDVLVQYAMALDTHAEEYDYYESEDGLTVKYDLVTKLITAKNGKVTDLDMNYVIEYAMSAYELERWDDTEFLADKVENLAHVYPIIDQQVDTSDAARDLVLMNNKGKIQKSVKLVDAQLAGLPLLVDDDLYLVSTLYGQALTNAKGKVLDTINNDEMEIVGDYIVGEKAIYNLSMEKVYDLRANGASVFATMNDTVFVMKGEDPVLAYDIIAFCDGEQETLCSFNAENVATTKSFITIENADCYAIFDAAIGEYTYYNAAGKELMKTKALLAAIPAEGQDTVLLSGLDGETTVYFALTK